MSAEQYLLFSFDFGFWAGKGSRCGWSWGIDSAQLFGFDDAFLPDLLSEVKQRGTGGLRVINKDCASVISMNEAELILADIDTLGLPKNMIAQHQQDYPKTPEALAREVNSRGEDICVYPLRDGSNLLLAIDLIDEDQNQEGEDGELEYLEGMYFVTCSGDLSIEPNVFYELETMGADLVRQLIDQDPRALSAMRTIYDRFDQLICLEAVAHDGVEYFEVLGGDEVVVRDRYAVLTTIDQPKMDCEDFIAELVGAGFRIADKRSGEFFSDTQVPKGEALH